MDFVRLWLMVTFRIHEFMPAIRLNFISLVRKVQIQRSFLSLNALLRVLAFICYTKLRLNCHNFGLYKRQTLVKWHQGNTFEQMIHSVAHRTSTRNFSTDIGANVDVTSKRQRAKFLETTPKQSNWCSWKKKHAVPSHSDSQLCITTSVILRHTVLREKAPCSSHLDHQRLWFCGMIGQHSLSAGKQQYNITWTSKTLWLKCCNCRPFHLLIYILWLLIEYSYGHLVLGTILMNTSG